MTPRERILKTLKGEKADQVPWFGDLDYWATALIAQGKRPPDFKASDEYLEWHRRLGVGFYLQGYFPFQEIVQGCEVEEWKEGERRYRRIRTPNGTLEECWKWSELTFSEAPIVRLVKTAADLPAYRYLFENMRYEPDYDFARRRARQVGEMGVVLCYLPRTPFMRMVAIDAGIENMVMMYAEDPDAFTETFRALVASEDRSSRLAVDSPAEILMMPENLSAEMVGPRFFELFLRDFQTRWSKSDHRRRQVLLHPHGRDAEGAAARGERHRAHLHRGPDPCARGGPSHPGVGPLPRRIGRDLLGRDSRLLLHSSGG